MAYFVFDDKGQFLYSSLSKIARVEEGYKIVEGPDELLMKSVLLNTDNKVIERPIPEIEKLKNTRMVEVSNIVVTVDGLQFDGNEKAQQRMMRAIILSDSDNDVITWVTADNVEHNVTVRQIRQACKQAFKEQNKLWIKPYKG